MRYAPTGAITKIAGRRINNPDQISSAYITTHGIPHDRIDEADAFLAPIRAARNERNRKEVDKINEIMNPHGISLDFDKDIVPISYAKDGGSITERHLAIRAGKADDKHERQRRTPYKLHATRLGDIAYQKADRLFAGSKKRFFTAMIVLNILKSNFVEKIYIQTTKEETIPVRQAVDFAKSINAIASYCYLGDVSDSPTGDKKDAEVRGQLSGRAHARVRGYRL